MNRPVFYSLLFLFSALLAAPAVSADGEKNRGHQAGKRSGFTVHAPMRHTGNPGRHGLKRYDGVYYFPKRRHYSKQYHDYSRRHHLGHGYRYPYGKRHRHYYRPYRNHHNHYYYGHTSVLPIIAGGVIGGVIGHELSYGDDYATAAGTVIGTVIGSDISRRDRRRHVVEHYRY